MNYPNSTSPRWSQRLQGYINLKTCLSFSAIALAGAFVVNLQAAEDESTQAPALCCGSADNEASKNAPNAIRDAAQSLQSFGSSDGAGIFVGGSVAADKIGPKGVVLLPNSQVPKDVTLVGVLTGPFVDLQTNRVVNDAVEINNAPTRSLIKGAIYQIEVVAQSTTSNLYGLTLGSVTKTSADLDVKEATPLRAILSDAAKTVHLRGDIESAALLQPDSNWQIATTAQAINSLPVVKKELTTNGVEFSGAMRGWFVNLFEENGSKNRFVFDTLDALALGDHGFLATNYGLLTTFHSVQSKAQIYGAALGSNPKENLLRADTDTPQKRLSLQGVVKGSRFISVGLGWGINNAAWASSGNPRIGYLGPRDKGADITALAKLPPLERASKVITRANAQVAPATTPTPTATPRPMSSNGQSIGGLIPVFFTNPINVGPIQFGADNAATGSTLNYAPAGNGTLTGNSDVLNACVRDQHAYQEGFINYFYKPVSDNDQRALAANTAWRSTFQPAGTPKEFDFVQPFGRRGVTYHWTQNVAVLNGVVFVHYQRGRDTQSEIKIVKYEEAHANPGDGEECPPRTNPEATPGVDITEDSDHDGTPDYLDPEPFNPNVRGPITPTPAPNH